MSRNQRSVPSTMPQRPADKLAPNTEGEVAQESVSMPISKIQKMVTLPWLTMFRSAYVAEQDFGWLSFMAAVALVAR
jgi:hypothetical protein